MKVQVLDRDNALPADGFATAVVTGGAGFIGSHLCDALIVRGVAVTCVDNLVGSAGSTRNVDHLLGLPGFRLIEANLGEWLVDADLKGVDVVFHQAASKSTVSLADPLHDLAVNAADTLDLLLAVTESGVRKFVHGSTGSVFGHVEGVTTEFTARIPLSFYGVSKMAGEAYCEVVGSLFGLDYTVLRYYNVIGSRQDDSEVGGVVPIFIRNCRNGEPITIFGDGSQVRCFTAVHDVVRANLLAASDPRFSDDSFNCASGVQVSILELAEFVIAEMGTSTTIRYDGWRVGDIRRFTVDNSRIVSRGMDFDSDWRGVVRSVIAAGGG